ncbi:sensor domain-containing diguanylate cyclase [Algibacillus agarilyticus]|uniref:sensor domain-containing diguanylate cyclase n=1 Tax=Algibacillus agarilyticus TaxID=2234133 RepID=UPI000DD04E98|nr:sensor domain-containing diguanylate cyclase [Algibacillus agarilyticus]
MQFNYRIVFIITALLFTLSVSLTSVNYYASMDLTHTQLKNSALPLTVDNIYTEIQKQIIEPNLIASMMAHDTFMKDWLANEESDTEQVVKYLDTIQNKYQMFATFLVSEKTQNYYSAAGLLEKINKDNAHNQWYFSFKQTPEAQEINIDKNAHMGPSLVMFINHKIFDNDFHMIGATGVGLKTSYINDMLKQFRLSYHFNVYFINEQGQVIISELDSHSINHINEVPELKQIKSDLISKGSQLFEYERQGERIILNRKYIPELDLYLLVEAKMNDFTKEVKETFYFNIVISLLLTLAITLIILIYVRNIHRKLNQLADNDQLTGLPNRRFFNRGLAHAMQLKKRNNINLSVLFLDLDNFKKINDTQGHDVGDEVLKRVAKLLDNTTRGTDFAARWGGEEFVILLFNSNAEGAAISAEKLGKAIEQDQALFDLVGHQVTISLGVTAVQDDDDIDAIIKRVDGALYKAKAAGKNQFIVD